MACVAEKKIHEEALWCICLHIPQNNKITLYYYYIIIDLIQPPKQSCLYYAPPRSSFSSLSLIQSAFSHTPATISPFPGKCRCNACRPAAAAHWALRPSLPKPPPQLWDTPGLSRAWNRICWRGRAMPPTAVACTFTMALRVTIAPRKADITM